MHRTTGTPSGSRELILDVVMPAAHGHDEVIGPDRRRQFGQQRLDVLRLHRQDDGVCGGGRLGDVERLHAVGVGEIARALRVLLDHDDVSGLALSPQHPGEQRLTDLAAAEQGEGVHCGQPFETRDRAKNIMFAGRSASRRIK